MDFKCFCVYLFAQFVQTLAQVYPTGVYLPQTTALSIHGSSATGHCSSVTTGVGADGSQSRCDAPTSSVLFDGNIPTLTGLDGDMWASQLLTLTQTTGSPVDITFDFTTTPGYVGVRRIEVVMFNCPERGIAVQTIRIKAASNIIKDFNIDDTSCDSLVKVCIPVSITRPVIKLGFFLSEGANFYLAEVTFYSDRRRASCRPGPITTATTLTNPNTAPKPTITVPVSTTRKQLNTPENSHTENTKNMDTNATGQEEAEARENNNTIPLDHTKCRACLSCSTSTLLAIFLTAIATALLATIISVLVQIATCKHFLNKINLEKTRPAEGGANESHRYEQPNLQPWSEPDNETTSHTYMEIEHGTEIGHGTEIRHGTEIGHGTEIRLEENHAYAVHTQEN